MVVFGCLAWWLVCCFVVLMFCLGLACIYFAFMLVAFAVVVVCLLWVWLFWFNLALICLCVYLFSVIGCLTWCLFALDWMLFILLFT